MYEDAKAGKLLVTENEVELSEAAASEEASKPDSDEKTTEEEKRETAKIKQQLQVLTLTHSLSHTHTPTPTHSLTHPLTHSLTHLLMCGCVSDLSFRLPQPAIWKCMVISSSSFSS